MAALLLVVVERAMSMRLALWQLLGDDATLDEEASDVVEHTVHVAATARGTVYLGEVYILIDGNGGWDAREVDQLGDGNLHDDHVHISQAREVPVAGSIAHVALVSVAVEDGGTEELASEVAVLGVLIFWQQLLLCLLGWVEALDGLQHEGINDVLVVVPVERLLLQEGIEVLIVLDKGLVETAPELTVLGVLVESVLGCEELSVDIIVVEVARGDGRQNLTNRLYVFLPCGMLYVDPIVQHLVLLQLHGEAVEGEARRRFLLTLALGTSHLYIIALASLLGNRHDELQHVVIQVVRLGEAEQQLLLSSIDVVIAVLIVCVG